VTLAPSLRRRTATPRSASTTRSRRPPKLALAYALAIPLVVIPLPIQQSIGAIDVLLPFGLIALLRQRWSVNRGLAGIFTIFVIGSSTTTITLMLQDGASAGNGQVWLIVRMFAIFVPMFLVLNTELIDANHLRLILKVALFSTSATCVIGIVMFALNIQVRTTQQRIWNANGSSLRAGGLLGNSGDMGHIAAILGVAACSLGVVYLSRRWIVLPLVALALYVTYISSSRAALLSMLVALLIMTAMYFSGRRILIAMVGLPIALIAASVFLVPMLAAGTDATLRRFDILNLSGQSQFFAADSRLGSWDRLLLAFQQNPFLGVGYGNGLSGDNSFLSMLSETGLVPGIAYCVFWVALLIAAIRLPAGPSRIAAVATVCAEIAFMLTIDTHRMWPSTGVCLLLIAVAFRLAQQDSDPTRGRTK
jgi:O-antigen ligase